MQPIRTFNVSPSLPTILEPLRKLAYNLHWDWNVDTKDLFRRLDRDLWDSSNQNPVLMLGTISQERLQEMAEDDGFIAQMKRAAQQLDDYLKNRAWYRKERGTERQECYAYFSMEFGLVKALPIYSGGLGVLAGDHLKSASDLGLPLAGVGLLYQEGYFSQYLNADGWQQERYPLNDFYNMPLHLERNPDGSELRIEVDYPGRKVYARIWRVQVGTVPLYLMDTNIEPNSRYDQDISDQLYGGDKTLRMHQEIMLGIGGVKMLKALGLTVTAYHMNEGHAAFMALERIRMLMEEYHLSFVEAEQVVVSSSMFTTHTPVPAGFDLFEPDMVMHYLGQYAKMFGLSQDEFLALGRENVGDLSAPLNMAILAIKMSSFVNGVAALHGVVSRPMFQGLWPGLPQEEVPITSITNGVHARSCVAKSTQELYDRYLGPEWEMTRKDDRLWDRISSIPDEELWRNHERCRSELVVFAREWLQKTLRERGAAQTEIEYAREALNPKVLTIGFARRFATYKRATLFLRDVDRIMRIMRDQNRPVQFVIAGKAHPMDIPGKELIRDIVHFIREHETINSMVFLPNYDINVARMMVSGCDVWLNTPRRPREASGTSGMKAAMNGLPNLSILDGWWDEADYVRTGWPIGHGEFYEDTEYQDEVEANALYDLMEKEVVPLFYNRDADGIPRGWTEKMKDSIRLNCPFFNTARMVKDYARRAYFPVSDRFHTMTSDNCAPAKELSHWKKHVLAKWYDIKIESVDISQDKEVKVNQSIAVKSRINLMGLTPADVQVELYQGSVDANGDIVGGVPVVMEYLGEDDRNASLYTADITYTSSGLQGLSLRVLPKHDNLSSPYEAGVILWAH
ncbi:MULTISPECIES: alpha-glucan family phosphorylase [unclassified Microcoleus]|uniref:alpha-glucan family phosphorylase n=1 Tax=unclassified Microcoleus TaxID=2642155 RepID=UPI002FCF3576